MEGNGLRCEWLDCDFEESTSMKEFCCHMIQHKPHIEIREDDNAVSTWYCCMWESCGFDSPTYAKVVFHINYHAFHTKIKLEGCKVIQEKKLSECHLDFAGRNLFTMLPTVRVCNWEDCGIEFDNYQYFVWHVQAHMKHKKGYSNLPAACKWNNCYKKCKSATKLLSHGKVHTGERVTGCPTCGAQFANKTKLVDHCARQSSNKKYQCSQCFKSYASERILRDHIRVHIDCYNCPLCELTFPYPSSLTNHMRFRHIDTRHFKCNFCDHRTKIERDLESHQLTHCNENLWVCDQEGCEHSCRFKEDMLRHKTKVHKDGIRKPFICHECDFKCSRGALLTKHLRSVHSYRAAPGQPKFRYIKGKDGLMRLQTFRYTISEVLENAAADDGKHNALSEKTFHCNQTSIDEYQILIGPNQEANNKTDEVGEPLLKKFKQSDDEDEKYILNIVPI